MKDQIKIRVLDLGWDYWHHPWYTAGHEFTGEESAEHIKKLMKRDKNINISAKPPVYMPTRKNSRCWAQYLWISSYWMQKKQRRNRS